MADIIIGVTLVFPRVDSREIRRRDRPTIDRHYFKKNREYRVSIKSLYNFKNLLPRQVKIQTSGNYYRMRRTYSSFCFASFNIHLYMGTINCSISCHVVAYPHQWWQWRQWSPALDWCPVLCAINYSYITFVIKCWIVKIK